MNRMIPAAAILAAALAIGACGGASSPDADQDAVNTVRTELVAAVNAEDAAKAASYYTEDAVRMEDNQPAYTSRQSIQAAFEEVMRAYDCDISLRPEETVIAGDWAFDRGQYMTHMMPRAAGADMIMDQGKYLAIYQKQPDGSWRVAREIANSNVPIVKQ